MRKSIIVAGATGMVGKEVVAQLSKDNSYTDVYVLVRRKTAEPDRKIHELLVDYDTLSELPRADSLVICLGTTRKKAGSKEAFRKVDFDYVVSLGQLAKKAGVQKVIVVSSIGANSKSSNFYLKTKGEMEDMLISMNFKHLCIVRPSLLLGNRTEFRMGETIAKWVQWLLGPFYLGILLNYKPVKAEKVAETIIKCEQTMLENLKIVMPVSMHRNV